MKAQPDLLLSYMQRGIQRRTLPDPPTVQQEAMSEVLVGLIANLIVWTFIAVVYFS